MTSSHLFATFSENSQKAISKIIKRHEIFRTTFPQIDGQPPQIIHQPCPIKIEYIDLTKLSETEKKKKLFSATWRIT